ncbi:MAG: isoaspartyl peptidase/L-asparaginase [Chloracidobacterium sp.]|uniref:Isoaspartyl peptidase/L-asparaginase n=1 Tax=Chloracidobacterium validum TaxID=2821543 RepID=A0ABX8BCJ6_9BACT|nr:isoaspartyl peptidase/L-asparaginase [Chloracidobacterium validum]QUW04563.1 isoaspartyl peptidase/L-asparaginase [Chloracidobacterium validum]
MNRAWSRRAFLTTTFTGAATLVVRGAQSPPIAFAIHGGAGVIEKQAMSAEREALFRLKLTEAVTAGHNVLKRGGSALDAVVTAIVLMEDSGVFNAGKGAVFTNTGTCELDASIMNGANRAAGAVAGVKRIKNPIRAARAVMERSPHVLMTGVGAEAFAAEQGLTLVSPKYFGTEEGRRELEKLKAEEAKRKKVAQALPFQGKFGTVGAVALDAQGNLAAGTSTGGMSNKRFGRVGDAPIIGAGTYADNATCAVSCTGHGEYFIRSVVAHDIAALVAYKGWSLQQAAEEVVMKKLVAMGGMGGLVALDRAGNITMPFNSPGMHRASIGPDGRLFVGIYREDG